MKMCHETNGAHPTSESVLSSLRSQARTSEGKGVARRGALHVVPHVRLGRVLGRDAGGVGLQSWQTHFAGIATRFTPRQNGFAGE